MSQQPQKVVIVGGGPVGALAALYAARRGYETHLYELRDDPNHGDSSLRPDLAVIPLDLSERGMRAIEGAGVPGLLDRILADSRPIYTRMIHTRDRNGAIKEIPMAYGPQGQCLNTIPRERVTKHCLLALEKEPTAHLHFNHKLTNLDFDRKLATFELVLWKDTTHNIERADDRRRRRMAAPEDDQPLLSMNPLKDDFKGSEPTDTLKFETIEFDFLIGADGTFSSVRQHLMRHTEIDFSQVYTDALWCDFIFPSDKDGNHCMDSKCLHLWPADENIVMAQPDFYGSFRAGMVCRTDYIRHYEKNPDDFPAFFDSQFPGIVDNLLTREQIKQQFITHQKIPLKSVKLSKFGWKDDVLLLGDAAHTMTPFHAMGMITGLEDVRIFYQHFRDPSSITTTTTDDDNNNKDTGTAAIFCPKGVIGRYTEHRRVDVNDMVDLASEHYYELRHGVRSTYQRARRAADAMLSRYLPFLGWAPLYARIQFSHERFSSVRKNESRQKHIGNAVVFGLAAAAMRGVVVGGWMIARHDVVQSWFGSGGGNITSAGRPSAAIVW